MYFSIIFDISCDRFSTDVLFIWDNYFDNGTFNSLIFSILYIKTEKYFQLIHIGVNIFINDKIIYEPSIVKINTLRQRNSLKMIKEEILIIENEFVEKIIRGKKENLMELNFILIIYIYLIYF